MTRLVRLAAPKLSAIALIAVAALATSTGGLSSAEQESLADSFSLEVDVLADVEGLEQRSSELREVHPDLYRIRSWISAVGASAALGDVFGDGLPNDLCHVDTRFDVTVLRSLAQPEAYEPVVLEPQGVPYDTATTSPMGCVLADLTADGVTDVLVYFWGRSPLLFTHDGQTGAQPEAADFTAHEMVSPMQVWNTNALAVADLDGSGMLDVVVGNYFPDDAPILDPDASSHPAVQMQDSMSRALNGGTSQILRNVTAADRVPAFEQDLDALPADAAAGWTLAVGAVDLDGDLLPEIYLANDFGHDRLLHNRSEGGELRFETVEGSRALDIPSSKVLGRGSFKGMGIDFADSDLSGELDLFISNIAAEFALHESHHLFVRTGDDEDFLRGRAPFTDESERLGVSRSGWGWDAKFADLNNSGDLELVQATGFLRGTSDRWPQLQELAMGNDRLLHRPGAWPRFQPGDDLSGHDPNPVFVRGSDGRFHDLAAELGLGDPMVTRGIAVADIEGDGGLDLFFANQWEPSVLARNACTDCGRYLGLDLLLPVDAATDQVEAVEGRRAADFSARPAIGAQVVVRTDRGTRRAHVDGASGHSGQREPAIHIGLGDEEVRSVDVFYRDAAGNPRQEALDVDSGWHTVVLTSARGGQ